jgi:hypothetical protein
MQRLEGGLRDAFVGEALGCQEVQRRVIGRAEHGERGRSEQQLVVRHGRHGLVQRPRAHLLAQVDVVLDDVGLRRLDLETADHETLGLVETTQAFEQPG